MNSKLKFLTLVLATGAAGLTAFGLSNTELVARLPLDAFLGAALSLGPVYLAFADYSRQVKPLRLPATVLRPAARRVVRISAGVERVAA
jgi:hypothetical protein